MSIRTNVKVSTIAAAGATVTYDCDNAPEQSYRITTTAGGAVALLANQVFTYSGTPVLGQIFNFFYEGQVTIGAFNLTFFGTNLTAGQALYRGLITCFWDGSGWKVYVNPDATSGNVSIVGGDIVAGSILNAQIGAAAAIAITKIAALAARGYMIRGGVNGVLEGVNAVTSGTYVGGNGTDVGPLTMSGAITLSATGVATIANNYITKAMLAYTPMEYYEASLTIATASVLTLNGTPITIVAAPGAGKYIEVVSASASMTFVSAAYAANTTLRLKCAGATIAQLQDTAILLSTVTKNTKFKDVTSAAAGETQIITNAALQVDVATGNPTTGDSNLIVKVVYRIVTI